MTAKRARRLMMTKEKMPRTSESALQALRIVKGRPEVEVVERLRAPAELTDEQREEWNRVIGAMPADWFHEGNVANLVQYCRHVTAKTGVRVQQRPRRAEAQFDSDRVGLRQRAHRCATRNLWCAASVASCTRRPLKNPSGAANKAPGRSIAIVAKAASMSALVLALRI